MKKKILAIVLAAMCLTMFLPTTVFARNTRAIAFMTPSTGELTLTVGETGSVEIRVNPYIDTGEYVEATSTDATVATVNKIDNNHFQVSAVGAGETTIAFVVKDSNNVAISDVETLNVTVSGLHTVTCLVAKGAGTVTVDKEQASAGETVTITATPDAGYKSGTLTGTTNGEPIDISEAGTFTMPNSDVIIFATFVEDGESIETITVEMDNPIYGQKVLSTSSTVSAVPMGAVKVIKEKWEKFPTGTDPDFGEDVTDPDEVFQKGYEYFYSVRIEVEEGYEVTEDTKCTFNGKEVEICMQDGNCFILEETFTPSEGNPKTGDSNNMWLYAVIAVLALGAIGTGIVVMRKKANR